MSTPAGALPNSSRKNGRSDKRSAGPGRSAAGLSGDELLPEASWASWQAHLAGRGKPQPLAALVANAKIAPLLWSVPQRCEATARPWLERAARIHLASSKARGEFARDLLQEMAGTSAGDPLAVGLTRLAGAHALPHLAGVLTQEEWRLALEQLLVAVDEAAALPLEEEPLGRLLLAGELPWTLTYLFPELGACQRLAGPAEAALAQGLLDLLDGEGVLAGRHLPLLRPLLALWTRCGVLGRAMNRPCFAGEADEQYSWLVQRAILLARPDGGQMLASESEGRWCEDLFTAALSLDADPQDEALARAVLPLSRGRRSAAGRRGPQLPQPAFHSEWAEAALLRPQVTRKSPRLAVSFADRRLLAELTNRSAAVFSGAWDPHIEVDGRPLTPSDGWEEVCWVSDSDLDYLELEMALADGWRVQRQLLLAREDEFLFAADAILGPAASKIEYRCTLPLCPGVEFVGEPQTRDGELSGTKRLAVVLPLALPEWRTDRRPGSLAPGEDGLTLHQSAAGRAMFAPWFLDLAKRRFRKPRTWRQLTVAERLNIQPPDVAVGYRVQVGDQQWLFYRSLAPSANRTVLGQNLSSEFVAGRFTRAGNTEELVSISSAP